MIIQLVTVTIEDTPLLATIHITAWKEAYKNIIPKEYLEFYIIKDSLYNIAIVILTLDNDKHIGEITALYLLEQYHYRGIGRNVMNLIKECFINDNYHEIRLWALKNNIKAIRFYEKNNFTCIGNINKIICGKELDELEFIYYFGIDYQL